MKTFHKLRVTSLPLTNSTPTIANLYYIKNQNITVEQYREIYVKVGSPWGWSSRKNWDNSQILTILSSDNCEVQILCSGNELIGFFEIEMQSIRQAYMKYFGLIPSAIGAGYGRYLMQGAIACAAQRGISDLTLTTRDSDHCNALNLYRKMGFGMIETDK
jgi:ribosomal protein S18 acetylase RimI-like enzyme